MFVRHIRKVEFNPFSFRFNKKYDLPFHPIFEPVNCKI